MTSETVNEDKGKKNWPTADQWTLKKEDVWRLESCEMWLWRKVLNISWSDKVCNEEALRHVSEERVIISVTNRRQRALSIQPKIPEISVGTSKWNGPFQFGPTGIFGTSFEGGPL